MGQVSAAALIALAFVLAGCLDLDPLGRDTQTPDGPEDLETEDEGLDVPDTTPEPDDEEDPVEPPDDENDPEPIPWAAPATWRLGDAWTYNTKLGSEITLVVTADQGDDWIVDTTDPGTAWNHTRSEISYLERIRKVDLAGSQEDDRVLLYDFPLEDGKKWTTGWDGEERRIETVEENGTYRFEAYVSMRLAAEYDYDPEIGWFSKMVIYDNQTGEVSQFLELTKHHSGWKGQVVRWDANMQAHSTLAGLGVSIRNFTVEEGTEELWVRVMLECESDSDLASFQSVLTPIPPSDQTTVLADSCLTEEKVLVIEGPDPTVWGYWLQMYTSEPENGADLEMETWSRNQVILDVP